MRMRTLIVAAALVTCSQSGAQPSAGPKVKVPIPGGKDVWSLNTIEGEWLSRKITFFRKPAGLYDWKRVGLLVYRIPEDEPGPPIPVDPKERRHFVQLFAQASGEEKMLPFPAGYPGWIGKAKGKEGPFLWLGPWGDPTFSLRISRRGGVLVLTDELKIGRRGGVLVLSNEDFEIELAPDRSESLIKKGYQNLYK